MIEKMLIFFVFIFGLFFVFVIFILFPVSVINEAKCLKNGYPKAYTTYALDSYCATTDGLIKVLVIPSN
jgi:protein-S-isoprenylcysteine O-methyltransferase Ste14